jgi:transposase
VHSYVCKSDKKIHDTAKIICTIPGIALLTASTILAETNGFELIKNKRQLVSYAGLDVRERQSGTSINGKSRISKKANKCLRKAMYFPAWIAIRG